MAAIRAMTGLEVEVFGVYDSSRRQIACWYD